MKVKKITNVALLLMLAVATTVGCNNDGDNAVAVTGVELSHNLYKLALNDVFTLTANVLPSDATNTKVSWTIEEGGEEFVSIVPSNDGMTVTLTAKKYGEAVITATTEDGAKTAQCVITVQGEKNQCYVVGYCPNVVFQDETAKSSGYLFISENLHDTLFTSKQFLIDETYCGISILHDDLFSFPKEIMSEYLIYCGPIFFPKEYRYAYKIQMTYEIIGSELLFVCTADKAISDIHINKLIVITSISKIQ